MGLKSFIERAVTLSRNDLLQKQLAKNKAKGLDDLESSALLILQRWELPQTPEMVSRAAVLAKNLAEARWVIGLLMFAQRIRIHRAMRHSFSTDPLFQRYGRLYLTAEPLTTFARECMNRLWDKERVDPAVVKDAAFAAYYATLVVPFAVDAWLMLAQLNRWGVKLEADDRTHVAEGIVRAQEFLEHVPNADPEFRDLLAKGIEQLREFEKK